MPHHTPLIATIVIGIVLAFVLGALANRLRLSPIIGYLAAGVVIGPATPGFTADQSLASELAEIGVILLMFGVGMHFSLRDLLSVRAIAIPGALAQIAVATLLGWGLAHLLGWSAGGGLVFGLALSVASTVVLLRALQERRLVQTDRGCIAVGWLIVEDIAMVLALVVLPPIAALLNAATEEAGAAMTSLEIRDVLVALGITLAKVAVFVVLMLVVGRRVIPWRDLIVTGAILSILINPLLFLASDHLAASAPDGMRPAETPKPGEAAGHIVLVGFGRVGSVVAEGLRKAGTHFVVIEDDEDRLDAARQQGIEAVPGNAVLPEVLELANISAARALVIAIPNGFEAGNIVLGAKALNPQIRIVARAHSDAEVEHLGRLGADHIIMGEKEIAHGMLDYVAEAQ